MVARELNGKVVLVTGAAGSIGSELCRQVLKLHPAKLLCLDQNETGLFDLQMELRSGVIELCLGDYTDPEFLARLFRDNRIQVTLHAAAYKHVPLMEAHPRAALHNNVFGLLQLLDFVDRAGCEAFVLLSSDKAVCPANVMGATKRIGELILASQPNSRMRCLSVRFGNVLGSRGSVMPIWQRQLSQHEPLTITDPEASRFFITIEEAGSLVLQALTIGEHRDVLVFDSGEPLRIADLARTMIRLSGKSENDVEIVITGLRPGEKQHEQLFYSNENAEPTVHQEIKRVTGSAVDWQQLQTQLNDLRDSMFKLTDIQLREKIRSIVPEFCVDSGMPISEPFAANPEYSSASADD